MFQLFTTAIDNESDDDYPFPIDHFYYMAERDNMGKDDRQTVVYLETHAKSKSGKQVSIVYGSECEEFDDIPSALRRMADIIEAHHNQSK